VMQDGKGAGRHETPLPRETRPPKVTRKEYPTLQKAWAYFDHFVLPRFIVDDTGTYDRHDLKRAEPGRVSTRPNSTILSVRHCHKWETLDLALAYTSPHCEPWSC
jgi:hypothetical protein